MQKKKEEKEHVEEEDQVLDWWTKYFASLQLFKEKQIDLPAMIKAADVVNPEAGEKQNEEGAVTDKGSNDGCFHTLVQMLLQFSIWSVNILTTRKEFN